MTQKPLAKLLPPPRPQTYSSFTSRYPTACGKIYITVCIDETGYPIEVFARMGKAGLCPSAFLDAVARTISVALRCGVDAAEIASQYIGISCTGGAWDKGIHITSCVTAIGMDLKRVLDSLGTRASDVAGGKSNDLGVPSSLPVEQESRTNDEDIERVEAIRVTKEQKVIRDREGLSG